MIMENIKQWSLVVIWNVRIYFWIACSQCDISLMVCRIWKQSQRETLDAWYTLLAPLFVLELELDFNKLMPCSFMFFSDHIQYLPHHNFHCLEIYFYILLTFCHVIMIIIIALCDITCGYKKHGTNTSQYIYEKIRGENILKRQSRKIHCKIPIIFILKNKTTIHIWWSPSIIL